MRLRPPLALLNVGLAALLPLTLAFSCDAVSTPGNSFNLEPLKGLRTSSKQTDTPPTKTEVRFTMNLCESLGKEEGKGDEDQCPDGTRMCLRLVNHKESASDPERVTAVIPLWNGDDSVAIRALGNKGAEGLVLSVLKEYAGMKQNLEFTLKCDKAATDENPTLDSYTDGVLKLTWATPSACPTTAAVGGGGGFWSTINFLIWSIFFVLLAYFVLGALYNHQQYSARGWDLVPHRDFWRELPTLASDLSSHLFNNVRSSAGRGGYSSLG